MGKEGRGLLSRQNLLWNLPTNEKLMLSWATELNNSFFKNRGNFLL